MTCPVCGSPLKERTTDKGVLFMVCARWPNCRVSGTPPLIELCAELQKQPKEPEPVRLGDFVTKLVALRKHQCRLRKAKTAEERERIRTQALEAIR